MSGHRGAKLSFARARDVLSARPSSPNSQSINLSKEYWLKTVIGISEMPIFCSGDGRGQKRKSSVRSSIVVTTVLVVVVVVVLHVLLVVVIVKVVV
ncbi:hypothetical protein ElyMa_000802800 [Elysia marginata]|uniref:Transmembrane protein n=1 Tax=Elysia marginata TaxID=1093978 RepID=A0AAV4GZT4_9GAST|nr:hypothetical protein ElyMa_000802800 [Elysia marginata]